MARMNFGGVLTRQLVGGNRNKHQLRARLLSNSVQTLNSSGPSKTSPPQPPQTTINWKLAAAPAAATSSVYYRYSLLHYHPNPNPNPNLHFVRHKHSVPLPDGVRDPAPRPPPNVFFLNVAPEYDDALKQVEDENLSAVFYFTERWGPDSVSYSSDDPILNYMCVFYPHITKFRVCFFKVLPHCTSWEFTRRYDNIYVCFTKAMYRPGQAKEIKMHLVALSIVICDAITNCPEKLSEET